MMIISLKRMGKLAGKSGRGYHIYSIFINSNYVLERFIVLGMLST